MRAFVAWLAAHDDYALARDGVGPDGLSMLFEWNSGAVVEAFLAEVPRADSR